MATSVAECDEIISEAQAAGVKVGVAHSDLFYDSFMKARELVTHDVIGECRGMRIFLSTPTDYMTSRPDHWAHKLPGGVFGESGPHVVYMTLAFINPTLRRRAGKKVLDYPWSQYETTASRSSARRRRAPLFWPTRPISGWRQSHSRKQRRTVPGFTEPVDREIQSRRQARSDWALGCRRAAPSATCATAGLVCGRIRGTHELPDRRFCGEHHRQSAAACIGRRRPRSRRVMNMIVEEFGSRRQTNGSA